jgi:hypothetical protein
MSLRTAPWFVADFDSTSAMVRASARFLHGEDFPGLGLSRRLEPLAIAVNYLPKRVRRFIYMEHALIDTDLAAGQGEGIGLFALEHDHLPIVRILAGSLEQVAGHAVRGFLGRRIVAGWRLAADTLPALGAHLLHLSSETRSNPRPFSSEPAQPLARRPLSASASPAAAHGADARHCRPSPPGWTKASTPHERRTGGGVPARRSRR